MQIQYFFFEKINNGTSFLFPRSVQCKKKTIEALKWNGATLNDCTLNIILTVHLRTVTGNRISIDNDAMEVKYHMVNNGNLDISGCNC